jgi:formylglycine-generating enzyme required for sulfatase activity
MTRGRRVAIVAAVAGAAVAAVVAIVARRGERDEVQCGDGFRVEDARCIALGAYDPPDVRVRVPETTLDVGPSDWEAEGRVAPRTVRVAAFAIDAFEATVGRFAQVASDRARAASGMTRDEAAAWCLSRGGRLPTEDEWMAAAAAAGEPERSDASGATSRTLAARRYPWGDTGAVCRRAAWGLAAGPCATGAGGPDTVGAHASGDTPLGIHDMAGNVAEWVAPDPNRPGVGVAKGGSWSSRVATELRTWSRLELAPDARDARVGVRCAFD